MRRERDREGIAVDLPRYSVISYSISEYYYFLFLTVIPGMGNGLYPIINVLFLIYVNR